MKSISTSTRPLLDHRLVVVTGKGGVGKTAISCALAEAAHRAGKRVLLAETATLEAVAARFEPDAKPLGYTGRSFRPGLHALRVDPNEALADYVRLQLGLGAVTDRVLRSETFQHLLEAAPGWRELIVLGKIWHLEQKLDDRDAPLYDLLIVDAPATGHGLTFLDVPRVVQKAIRTGPLARHASWVEALVHDRERTLLLPVTLAEELAVTETVELVERAREVIDIAVDRLVVNRVTRTMNSKVEDSLDLLSHLPKDLRFEHLPPLDDLLEIARHSARRGHLAHTQRIRASRLCNLPIVNFPELPGGVAPINDWGDQVERLLADPAWPEELDIRGPES